jgi:hypothetical protein
MMLKGSRRSAEFRDANHVVTMYVPLLTRSQNVFVMVDLPVPARPASQKMEREDAGSAAQASMALKTSSRVFSRHPVGEVRES